MLSVGATGSLREEPGVILQSLLISGRAWYEILYEVGPMNLFMTGDDCLDDGDADAAAYIAH